MEVPAAEEEPELESAMDHFPFMLHVLVVLVITWLLSSLRMNSLLFLCMCAIYLFQIDKRIREKEKRHIAFEERKKIHTRMPLSEGETLRWLNVALKRMWPVCMEKFASKHFFGAMAPWFLDTYKPKGVNKVTLQRLELGSTPPIFSFIRALKHPQDGDHVEFEAAMEFVSGSDMNAEMSVQTSYLPAITFYISKLQMEGTVKFSVKFLRGWPVIGRVRFCFANAPRVTVTARPILKKGVDVSLFPGAKTFLENTLANALEKSVVEPYMLVVDMEKLVSKMMFPIPKPQLARANGNGPPDFFYVEDKSSSMVRLEILGATGLKALDKNGSSDPFVVVALGQHKLYETKVIQKTIKPLWNEEYRFPIVNWDLANNLTMHVKDQKRRPDNLGSLGICSVALKEFRDGSRHELTLKLDTVSTGYLRCAITVEEINNVPQVLEDPRTSVGSQPTTQDLNTNGSGAIHTPPSTGATVKSSESDSNSKRSKKQTRRSLTEEIERVPTLPIQTGDTFEIIDMPYGAHGAFQLQRPGPKTPVPFPALRSTRKPKPSRNEKSTVDVLDREGKKSKMSIFKRKKRSTGGPSPEHLQEERETNMSEQSGYTSSLDRSMELKNVTMESFRSVKMNLLSPDTHGIASSEPPDMFVLPPGRPQQLEPILSSQDPGSKTPDTQSFNLIGGPNLDVGEVVDGSISSAEPGFVNGTIESGVMEVVQPNNVPQLDAVGSLMQQELEVAQRPPTAEKQNLKNTSWWKKLPKRPKRKTKSDSKGISAGTFVEGESKYYDYSDQSNTSAPPSFRKDEVDTKAVQNMVNLESREEPEARKIINSSRASGSQSCRQESIYGKKILNGGVHISQSLRHEPSKFGRLMDIIHPNRDSLRTIPEKLGPEKPLHVHPSV